MVFASMAIAACATNDETQLMTGRLPNYPVPFIVSSGFTEKQLLVVSSDEEWRKVWASLFSNRRPSPAIPTINFAEQMVLIYALGRQRTGGYSVQISGVEAINDQLSISVAVTRPSPNCMVTTGLTSPADLLLVPLSNRRVVVVETEIVTEC